MQTEIGRLGSIAKGVEVSNTNTRVPETQDIRLYIIPEPNLSCWDLAEVLSVSATLQDGDRLILPYIQMLASVVGYNRGCILVDSYTAGLH